MKFQLSNSHNFGKMSVDKGKKWIF